MLKGKVVCLVGELSSLSRMEAFDLIMQKGGRVAGSVSKQTDILILARGKKDYDNPKYLCALELNKCSAHIEIIDGEEFLKMVNDPRPGQTPQTCFNSEYVDPARATKALGADLTPIALDQDTCTGTFVGSEGNTYSTTLEECTCPDFSINAGMMPCKHMIRLAMELGLYPSEGMKTDRSAANAKYYMGVLSQYAHIASISDVLKLYKITEATLEKGMEEDPALLSFAGVPDMLDSGIFVVKGKKPKLVVSKAQKVAVYGLQRTIKLRLGDLMLQWLEYEPFMKMVKMASEESERLL